MLGFEAVSLSRLNKSRRCANGSACDLGRTIRIAADETFIEFTCCSSLKGCTESIATAVPFPTADESGRLQTYYVKIKENVEKISFVKFGII